MEDHWGTGEQPGGGPSPGSAAVVPLAPAATDPGLARPVVAPQGRATAAPPKRSRPSTPASPVAEALGTIAHELRTPLATLQVSLEILTEFPSLRPEEVQELVQRL